MNGRTCQLCGKPLSRFTVGSGGDFCSREHRNQFRLRSGMDRLMEANKVASLMRRRENAKAIPAAQLTSDYHVLPRSSPHLGVPVRPPATGSLPLRNAALEQTRLSATSRSLLAPQPVAAPATRTAHPMESGDSFTGRQTRPILRPRTQRFPVQIRPAGVVIPPLADANMAARRRKASALGLNLQRRNVGGDGIQVRPLHSALRSCQEARPARGLNGSADRGRELRVSGGVGFRLPARRLRPLSLAGPRAAVLRNATEPRGATLAVPPVIAAASAAKIGISVRELFGPTPPAKNGAISFRWPSAIVPGARLLGRAGAVTRPCDIAWKAPAPNLPQLRLKNGAFRYGPSATTNTFPAAPAPRAIESVSRLTLVRFEPPETPFECSPTALHGTLVSGMQSGTAAARKTDSPTAPVLEEHFDAGLHNWLGGTEDWKVDVAGVRAGSLALYIPSIELADYQLEFLARIDHRSVTWVFRAAGFNDYYQATLAVAPAGGYEFRRWAVIGGTAEEATGCPVPTTTSVITGRTALTLRTRVEGDTFSVFLDGQVIDTWTDSRLTTGGIGFVGAPDDRARLYWVKVALAGNPTRSIRSNEHHRD